MIPRLGVNIDHVATLRQLRGTPYPDLLEAARLCERGGAEQITIHLREDRRHIQDADLFALRKSVRVPLNLEMSLEPKMHKIARKAAPDWICLVPEKRQEVTTEGGLDVVKQRRRIKNAIKLFAKSKTKISLFVEPEAAIMKLCKELGAHAVELHTGRYCLAAQKGFGARSTKVEAAELNRIELAGHAAAQLGLHVNAGHGLDYQNIKPILAIRRENEHPLIEEYNIGHVIVCRAAIVGIEQATREMANLVRSEL
ncbi:MAG TPA: pyridoxine 5'-phosphate synthase [Oligoflexia bacterium]|nr:pyridoxine 5'-phosphate synthase [Oligoflexia bacterium]